MKTVNEIQQQINKLEAEKLAIENNIVNDGMRLLHEEASNLMDGVGEGFRDGNYYAPNRYYSQIDGVKNIRQHYDTLEIKITTPRGALLEGKTLTVKGQELKTEIIWSKKASYEVDY